MKKNFLPISHFPVVVYVRLGLGAVSNLPPALPEFGEGRQLAFAEWDSFVGTQFIASAAARLTPDPSPKGEGRKIALAIPNAFS